MLYVLSTLVLNLIDFKHLITLQVIARIISIPAKQIEA